MDLSILSVFLVSLVSVALGIFFGLFINKIVNKKNIQAAKEAANQYIRRSESRSKEILIEAKEEAHNITLKTEKKLNRIQLDLDRTESRLETRENSINDLEVNLKNKNIELNKLVKKSEKNQEEIEISKKEIKQKLENITGLSVKEAKMQLLEEVDSDITYEISKKYRDAELIAQTEIDQKSKMILAESLQRYASEVVQENTVSAIAIPNEEMKGRLIGREGRNIRSIENITGTDLLIDEAPETVSVSCFDPVRRKIAIQTVEKLIQDGRIHPAKIEETYERSKNEIEEMVRKSGQNAVFEVNVKGLHPEIIKLMGRLQFRYSYGENVLQHCKEVGMIAAKDPLSDGITIFTSSPKETIVTVIQIAIDQTLVFQLIAVRWRFGHFASNTANILRSATFNRSFSPNPRRKWTTPSFSTLETRRISSIDH